MRTINTQFIQDLKSGSLAFFLEQARENPGICMEIRKNYVSMYYKGGCALRIEQHGQGYSFQFDSKYCLNKGDDGKEAFFKSLNARDASAHIEAFPVILSEMDSWFARHLKPERLFQHNLIKKNQGQLTILDIEYAGWTSAKKMFRLDMLGVVRADDAYKLIVFENKFGGGAISGTAGIRKHYDDIVDILSNLDSRDDLVASAIEIARIKVELGLLRGPLDLKPGMAIEILFLMAGYNMRSQAIANEVRKMQDSVASNMDASESGKMHASIPARICFQDVENTVIDYGGAKDLFA
jgi:hypothetical protein